MNRRLPEACHVAHGSWVWAVDVPRTTAPDPAAHGRDLGESLAVLRAMAADSPAGSALQLRYATDGTPATGPMVPYLVGRARTEADAETLARLVALTLPDRFGFRPVAAEAVVSRLVPFELDDLEPAHVVELRRVVDTIDPARPVVIPWSPAGTDTELGDLLVRADSATVLCIHVERCDADEELVEQLHATLQDLRDEPGLEADPALHRSLAAHRAWLRELPGGALQVRVSLVSEHPLTPGLADLVGLAMTDGGGTEHGGYRIVRPANRHELDLALQLIDGARAGTWGGPADGSTSALPYLCAPAEATAAFRLPRRAEGGARRDGESSSFPATCALLRRLAVEGATPFLVIDLSRGDYAAVADELVRGGAPVRRLRLDPTVRGFDPFWAPAGAGRHAHVARLLAAFDLAFGWAEAAPASWVLLSRAMFDIFDPLDTGEPAGTAPSLRALVASADRLMDRLALGTSGGHELRASLLGRLELLETGPLGSILCAGEVLDWDAVLAEPTVIELGGITGPRERTLVAGLLLAGLLAHRSVHPLAPGSAHVAVLAGLTAHGLADDATAPLAEGIAALAGSGQSFVPADVSATGPLGRLRAPDAWGLPIIRSGAWAPDDSSTLLERMPEDASAIASSGVRS